MTTQTPDRSVSARRLTLLGVMLLIAASVGCSTASARAADKPSQGPLCISGRYPSLAMFNSNGECGTGAVVPWAGKLWVITYGPHMPNGSDDKLYEIGDDLQRITHAESVGGTPADRMIHRESNQLIIGPYFIDAQGHVRVITPKQMPGRLTAVARHLTDPANKVYIYAMEGEIYEVDVHTLAVTRLFEKAVPGWHGKGAYTSQGRLVTANNGESHVGKTVHKYLAGEDAKGPEDAGALAEWDGKYWRIVERRQFTDVTTAGGINGAQAPDAPLWAIGWDKRSVMLKLLDGGKWSTFRLPKADDSYDGKHGWHTEWPRIRQVTADKYLMNMHGGWFDFPITFSAANTAGIRPIGTYLKITGDFAPWKDGIVFGCDDLALSDFGSGNLIPAGNQSQSNLWFTRWDDLSKCGKPGGSGGPWLHDAIKANEPSTPFLINGYTQRVLHLYHTSDHDIHFTLELDAKGDGHWGKFATVAVKAYGYAYLVLPDDAPGQWARIVADGDAADATAFFILGPGGGAAADPTIFDALPGIGNNATAVSGRLRARGQKHGTLLFESTTAAGDKKLLEIGPDLKFRDAAPDAAAEFNDKPRTSDYTVKNETGSVLVTQGKFRFRLPMHPGEMSKVGSGTPYIREIVTERSLLNAGGSFFMLPRTVSGGAAHIKPICTHGKSISDFSSWRGMMVISGARSDAKPDGHYFAADAGKCGLWFGDIDDLWKLGKPIGLGGPWANTAVKANEVSDPYLMFGYDRKNLVLFHDAKTPVVFTVQVDVAGDGTWNDYTAIEVPAGQKVEYNFPKGYSAHWVRVKSSTTCKATTLFVYQ